MPSVSLMREALYFMKISFSALSGLRRVRCSLMTSPDTLNSLSDGTLVGGGARYICTTFANIGNLLALYFHHTAGKTKRCCSYIFFCVSNFLLSVLLQKFAELEAMGNWCSPSWEPLHLLIRRLKQAFVFSGMNCVLWPVNNCLYIHYVVEGIYFHTDVSESGLQKPRLLQFF